MIPGLKTALGQLRVVAGPPPANAARLGGFALSPIGEIYTSIAGFSPDELFANGEQGAWYDPSDFSTMFQDSSGSTPVTAVEQPVGLILDKSKGLVLGPVLFSSDFSSVGGWNLSGGVTISGGSLNFAAETNQGGAFQAVAGLSAGKCYEVTFEIVSISSGAISASVGVTNGNNSPKNTAGVHVVRMYSTDNYVRIYSFGASTTATVDNISVKELPGNHASQSTTTARPILRQDAGGKYYLAFDGVDDSLSTAAIDFTATDKMSVFAGVNRIINTVGRKPIVMFMGDPYSVDGSFELNTPEEGSDASAGCRGSQRSGLIFPLVASRNVLTAAFNLRGTSHDTSTELRQNGVGLTGVARSYPTPGTGNFGNGELSIGKIIAQNSWFGGNIYSLIILGRTATAAEITATEAWVNGKTGAY